MSYTRFAIYYVPPVGDLAGFGGRWLGWDVIAGAAADQFAIDGLDDVTMTPRKYGFHGTLKPPFRLKPGYDAQALDAAVADLARRTAPATCDALQLRGLGKFLALTPTGDMADLARVAAACVTQLDDFRAPPTDAELARRRQAGLTPAQDRHLRDWGYPYVLDEFRFHLTLTGALEADRIGAWQQIAVVHLPTLPVPFEIASIALVGERTDGRFELIQRYALTG